MIFHFYKALETDLSDWNLANEKNGNELIFTIKITYMNQLIADLKTLVKNNWKIILIIFLVIFFLSNYNEVKSGFIDGIRGK